jgi:hypothetical protein
MSNQQLTQLNGMPDKKIQRCRLHSERHPCPYCYYSSGARLHRAKTDRNSSSRTRTGKSNAHPHFQSLVRHLNSRLAPLVSTTSGQLHPDFPKTMLAFNLLTSSQLDKLAHHFHQTWPLTSASWQYPSQMSPWIGTPEERDTSLYTKRKRFGSFIGLRDCETAGREPIGDYTRGIVSNNAVNVSQILEILERDWKRDNEGKKDTYRSSRR